MRIRHVDGGLWLDAASQSPISYNPDGLLVIRSLKHFPDELAAQYSDRPIAALTPGVPAIKFVELALLGMTFFDSQHGVTRPLRVGAGRREIARPLHVDVWLKL